MRVLVIGRTGQLACSLAERGGSVDGLETTCAGRPALDLLKPKTISLAVRRIRPDVIVNTAAYTAVDRAEDEPDLAARLNSEAPGVIAHTAHLEDIPLIHLSSDYIYDGRKTDPYVETDPANPQCVYGRTKLGGEESVRAEHPKHIIIRTAWVYSPFGHNFVKTILNLAKTRDRIAVVNDQRGNPTSALDLADAILAILNRWKAEPMAGLGQTFHCAGSGETTRFCLASHALNTSCRNGGPFAKVVAIATQEWPSKAPRPANSTLDCSKFAKEFGWVAPTWRISVDSVVRRLIGTSRTEVAAPAGDF